MNTKIKYAGIGFLAGMVVSKMLFDKAIQEASKKRVCRNYDDYRYGYRRKYSY